MPKTKSVEETFSPQPDRLPPDEFLCMQTRAAFEKISLFYGFEKMATSFLQPLPFFSALAKAGLLDERNVVSGKLKTGEDAAMRLSGALSILRAYVANKMNDLPHPLKFSFEGESFFLGRGVHAKLQSQEEAGLVMIGEEGPIAEAEIVLILWKTIEALGISPEKNKLSVNGIGCIQCRTQFRSSLNAYFRQKINRLCKNCKRSFKKNPTQILLCEEEKCAALASHAPQILDLLCEGCKKHLRGFLEFLDEMQIPYALEPKLFREGLWFNQLLFEISVEIKSNAVKNPAEGGTPELVPDPILARRIVIAEGGRMSRAGEIIVGRRLDAASATLFLKDTQSVLVASGMLAQILPKPKVFLAQLGDLAKRKSFKMLEMLRAAGIEVRESLGRDALKSQLTVAAHIEAEIALILGQKEALDQTVIVREVVSGIQETISQDKLVEFLRRKLKK